MRTHSLAYCTLRNISTPKYIKTSTPVSFGEEADGGDSFDKQSNFSEELKESRRNKSSLKSFFLHIFSRKNKEESELTDSEFCKIRDNLTSHSYEFDFIKRKYMRKDNVELFKFLSKYDKLDILYDRAEKRHGKDWFSRVEQIYNDKDLPNNNLLSIIEISNQYDFEDSIKQIKENIAKNTQMYNKIAEYKTAGELQENLKNYILDYFDNSRVENNDYINYENIKYMLDNMSYLGTPICQHIPQDIFASGVTPEYLKAKLDMIEFLHSQKQLKKYAALINNRNNDVNIVILVYPKNLEIAKALINMEDSPRIVTRALDLVNSGTEDFVLELLNNKMVKKVYSNYASYNVSNLDAIISKITPENLEMVKEVYEKVNKEKTIFKTLNNFAKKSTDTLDLCKKYNIPLLDMETVPLDKYNAKFIGRMYHDGRLNNSKIVTVSRCCKNNDCTAIAELMYEARRYTTEQICEVINNFRESARLDNEPIKLNKEALRHVENILKSGNVSPDIAVSILRNTEFRDRILKFADKVIEENKIPEKNLIAIFEDISLQNIDMVEKFYAANIKPQDIMEILHNVCAAELEDFNVSSGREFNLDDYRDYMDDTGELSRSAINELLINYSKTKIAGMKLDYNHIIELIKLGEYQNHPELKNYHPAMWDWLLQRGANVKGIKGASTESLLYTYVATGNPKINEQFSQLLKDAFSNRNVLRMGDDEITNADIISALLKVETIDTMNLIGKGNLEAAFAPSIYDFENFCSNVFYLMQYLNEENTEILHKKFNPESSEEYLKMQKEVYILKLQINNLIGEKARFKKAEIDNEISKIKSEMKTADKQAQKELLNQVKNLKYEAQKIYYESPNSAKILRLMRQINIISREMKKFIDENKVKMEPQDVITKMNVLCSLWTGKDMDEVSVNKDIVEFLHLIQDNTPENEQKWKDAVNKKIFTLLDLQIPYNDELIDKLDLIHCNYLSQIIASDEDFFDNFKSLVETIAEYQNEDIKTIIDKHIPQNEKTANLFTEKGLDYNVWTTVNPKSYVEVPLILSSDEAQKASVKNLEEDLNDELFKRISISAKKGLLKSLDKVGVSLKKIKEPVYDESGFQIGTKASLKLYKGNEPVTFDDMPKITKAIKEEMNFNEYWTTADDNNDINIAKDTLYDHLVRRRPVEVEAAKDIKESKTAYIKVQKTNMYDIKKALGLGNDAQCCTALGSCFNEWTAPNYIKNKCIGAIEIVDGDKFIGNTMMYIAEVNGELSLVLDNIELKTAYQNNDKIRDAIMEYAAKICEEIGKPDMSIYAGPNRHKVDMSPYTVVEDAEMKILGDTGNDEIYLDFDADAHSIEYPYSSFDVTLFKIR